MVGPLCPADPAECSLTFPVYVVSGFMLTHSLMALQHPVPPDNSLMS